jgi:hypothetical protein
MRAEYPGPEQKIQIVALYFQFLDSHDRRLLRGTTEPPERDSLANTARMRKTVRMKVLERDGDGNVSCNDLTMRCCENGQRRTTKAAKAENVSSGAAKIIHFLWLIQSLIRGPAAAKLSCIYNARSVLHHLGTCAGFVKTSQISESV